MARADSKVCTVAGDVTITPWIVGHRPATVQLRAAVRLAGRIGPMSILVETGVVACLGR